MADDIGQAAGQGDVRKVYKGVKVLARKPERPSPNITTDHEGNTLKSASDVAKAWNRFLSAKFSATDTEQLWRPERERLPDTTYTDGLTEEQFARGLSKMDRLQRPIFAPWPPQQANTFYRILYFKISFNKFT